VKRFHRSAACLALALLPATASAQYVESAEVAWAGTYTVTNTREVPDADSPNGLRFYSSGAKPVIEAERVPVTVDTRIGSGFVLRGTADSHSVQYQVVWRFPEPGMQSPEGKTSREWRSPPYSCPVGPYQPCLAGYVFRNEWEIVPGRWTLEVWAEGRRLFERSFEVYKP
jgi:hypothetical protein